MGGPRTIGNIKPNPILMHLRRTDDGGFPFLPLAARTGRRARTPSSPPCHYRGLRSSWTEPTPGRGVDVEFGRGPLTPPGAAQASAAPLPIGRTGRAQRRGCSRRLQPFLRQRPSPLPCRSASTAGSSPPKGRCSARSAATRCPKSMPLWESPGVPRPGHLSGLRPLRPPPLLPQRHRRGFPWPTP